MLVFNFKDYEGFKERFGLRECGNGNKSRQNKILLSFIKQHSLIKRALVGDEDAKFLLNIPDMATLLHVMKENLHRETRNETSFISHTHWCLADWSFFSDKYDMDGQNGICEDRDYRSVRYVLRENSRVFKMKAGKFLKNVMDESEWGRSIPEPVRLWLFEEFTQAWETYTRSMLPEYTLKVNDDFGRIYNSSYQSGGFGSCMNDHGYWTFYRDYVKAKAAYLEDNNGYIIARCIIFTEVHVDDGSNRVLRLAERQYSTDGEDVLKRCLVDALINAGEIDGYKRVGADCHSGRAFVLNDGTPFQKDMWIECSARNGDTCSYMDSFKYLNFDDGRAYNSDCYSYDSALDTTSGYVEGDDNYDSYHDEYTSNDVVTVYVHGREMTCDEDYLDDFIYIDGDYYHEDDCERCPECDEWFVTDDGYYSELTNRYYCCDSCRDDAEEKWKKENWAYSAWDGDYYEEVETFIDPYGNEISISEESLMRLRNHGRVWYDEEHEMWNATVRETETEEA